MESVLCSKSRTLELARYLLHQERSLHTTARSSSTASLASVQQDSQTSPLAVLLFLLDCLSFLAAESRALSKATDAVVDDDVPTPAGSGADTDAIATVAREQRSVLWRDYVREVVSLHC